MAGGNRRMGKGKGKGKGGFSCVGMKRDFLCLDMGGWLVGW